jgi:uncharacterized membrane protein
MSRPTGTTTATARSYVKQAFLAGLAITIPSLVTIVVLVFAFDFIANLLQPLTVLLRNTLGIGSELPEVVDQILAGGILMAVIFLIGVTAESRYGGGGLARRVENLFVSIPGIGSIYQSIDEISELLLESDTDSFREVKLIEYPDEGSYSLAFVTAETPDVVREATGHGEMVTLFMPMAPNPVMGGYVVHVSANRVYDVDMTVEEGIQSIVSSGVAVNEHQGQGSQGLSNASETGGGEML